MEEKKQDNKLIAKRNSLIPEFVKLGMQEKRFLAFCIAQLNPVKEKEFGRFTVNISEIAGIFSLPLTHTYPRIIEAAYAINSKPVLRTENKVRKMDFWFCWLDWEPESGQIEVQFNERLVPLLLDLRGGEYIQYPLAMAAGFTNRGWSLYELLKQWLEAGKKDFELDEIKSLLGIVGKYPKWDSINRYVIEPSVENINEVSDITVTYNKVKRLRAVIGVVFTIKKKADGDTIDLEPPEDELHRRLLDAGVNAITAAKYAREINRQGKADRILARLPGMIERAKKKGVPAQKYILGAIQGELAQGNLADLVPSPCAGSAAPEPEHQQQTDHRNALYRAALACSRAPETEDCSAKRPAAEVCAVCEHAGFRRVPHRN